MSVLQIYWSLIGAKPDSNARRIPQESDEQRRIHTLGKDSENAEQIVLGPPPPEGRV